MAATQFWTARTVRNLLTVAPIVVSAAAVVWTVHQDTTTRRHAEADQVRTAAGEALAKLERTRLLSLYVTDELHPAVEEASRLLAKTHSVEETRDLFWIEIDRTKISINNRAMAEGIENANTRLFGYDPRVRDLLDDTVKASAVDQEIMIRSIRNAAQCAILASAADAPTTARLGNALRAVLYENRHAYERMIDIDTAPARDFLIALAKSKDDDILKKVAVTRSLKKPPAIRDLNSVGGCPIAPSGARAAPRAADPVKPTPRHAALRARRCPAESSPRRRDQATDLQTHPQDATPP